MSTRRAGMRSAWCALGILAVGCGGGSSEATGFDGAPLSVATSDQGDLRIEVRTSPSPPTRGTNQVELRVSSIATSPAAPVDGLALEVVPWMPAMGHGASVKPHVTSLGEGRYLVDDVSLFMPGHWELRTSIEGTNEDHAAPAIDVP